jgi:ribosome recycling factor
VSEKIDDILLDAEEKMDKAIVVAREDFATIRAGRATTAMFAKVMVEYYGTFTPVNQLASFQIPEARSVLITPYDKGSFAAIEKALRDSDLGINPTSDGVVIRVNFPQLTEERRREYTKVAKHKAEDARVSVRNIRRHAKDGLDKLQKDGEAGEDDVRRAEKHLDDLTHKRVEHIDEILKHKEAELLEV